MAGESLIIGDGNWGVKSDSLLGYAVNSGRFVPRDLTFTRATTGTRTNGALLVETTPYNLAQYSEQLDQSGVWSLASAFVSSNTTISPSGLKNADTITTTSGSNFFSQTITVVPNTTYTFSFYALRGTMTDLKYSVYNLSAFTNIIPSTSYYSQTSSVNWTRISATFTTPAGCTSIYIYPLRDSGVTGDFYLWGVQLNEGSSVLDYLPTTTRLNIPRVDYSTGTAALLLEPQRTNINLQSEDISGWIRAETTAVVNTTTAPNGMLTADSLFETTATGTHIAFRDITGLIGTSYTFSIYAKSIGGRNIQLSGSSGFSGAVLVDLSNGNILSGSGVVSNVGNGWFRISITATTTTTAIRAIVYTASGSSTSYAGDVTKGVYLWGAQLEVGNCATSYIPTTSASVTRNADAIGRSGFQAAGLLTPTQNTFVFDLSAIGNTGSNYNFLTFTATSGLPIAIWRFAGSQNFHIQISGIFTDTGVASGKFAVVQSGSQTKLFVNGVLNTTGGATGTIDAIVNNIGIYPLASPTFIKSLKMYPTALSDAECINITK